MVLSLPKKGKELDLKQRDVRETPATDLVQSNFDATDFDVTTGVVSLKNKTSYWSINGGAFLIQNSATHTVQRSTTGGNLTNTTADGFAIAPVILPHGTIVTAAIVRGSTGGETWTLNRRPLDNSAANQVLATATTNTEDTSISNATIDNSTYKYWLAITSTMPIGFEIRSGKITYTTDYD